MPPAMRMGDDVIQMGPHCHAPIHPAAPVPTPMPHPPVPLKVIKGEMAVLIGNKPAARATDMIAPCTVCIPTPGAMIMKGSGTVLIGFLPAARLMDTTTHPGCVGPIPGPTGQCMGPGEPTVMIGG